jgi:ketosteroid isomerase-like protein
MAESNLELVRRAWEYVLPTVVPADLVNGRLDPLFDEFYDPAIEWDMSSFGVWPEEPVYRGHDGVRSFFGAWFGTFAEIRFEIEEHRELPNGVVVTVATQHGVTSGGPPVEMRYAQVFTLDGGRITRIRVYTDIDLAMREAAEAPPVRGPAAAPDPSSPRSAGR